MATEQKKTGGLNNLYVGRSTFLKVFLIGGVLVISALFMWYTFDVIEQLQRDTRDQKCPVGPRNDHRDHDNVGWNRKKGAFDKSNHRQRPKCMGMLGEA